MDRKMLRTMALSHLSPPAAAKTPRGAPAPGSVQPRAGGPGSVRSAAEGDLNGILEVERLSFPIRNQWDVGDFREALKDLFLVFADGGISGFLIASCWEDTKRAVILRIAGDPGHRNRGIATRLIEAALGAVRGMGLGEVEIDAQIVKRGA